MLKASVIKPFRDRFTDELHAVGSTFYGDDERVNALIKAGFLFGTADEQPEPAEDPFEVSEQPAPDAEPKPARRSGSRSKAKAE